MIATERLYRTTDNRVVREGDPAAAFLLCIPGEEIPAGYTVPDDLVVDEPAQDPGPGPDTAPDEEPGADAPEKPEPDPTPKRETKASAKRSPAKRAKRS